MPVFLCDKVWHGEVKVGVVGLLKKVGVARLKSGYGEVKIFRELASTISLLPKISTL